MAGKKEKIAVIFGGPSAESSVSKRSCDNIMRAMAELGLDATAVELTKNIGADLISLAPSQAYVITHGNPGEDGSIQGVLELLEIPYTYSGILASSAALDKKVTKILLAEAGIPVLKDIIVTASALKAGRPEMFAARIRNEFGLPVIVKPVREGSSVGVEKVDSEDAIAPALLEKTGKFGRVMVEPFIAGIEVTAGVLEENGSCTALPLEELRPKKGLYDFESKYTSGMTDFVIPARIPEETTRAVQDAAVRAFRAVGCEGAARIDFIVRDAPGVEFWVLEVNTIPGMTDTSDLPAEARAAGIGFPELVRRILMTARLKKQG